MSNKAIDDVAFINLYVKKSCFFVIVHVYMLCLQQIKNCIYIVFYM